MFGRTIVKAAALLLVMALVLSVAPGIFAQDEMSGTVSWYPQFYYAPDTRPEMSAAVEAVAQDYMDLHPGVTIKLEPSREAAYYEWLGTMMAAGTAPDIAWYHWQDRNNETRDWWVPLNEYLLAPNPYIAEGELGSERWIDTMPDNVTNNILAGDGNWYEIALDWIEIGLIYNADLAEQLGITMEWNNWGEFVADMVKVRDAGAIPVGMYLAPDWGTWWHADVIIWTAVYADVAEELYLPHWSAQMPSMPFRSLSVEEVAHAVITGALDYTDPKMDLYLDLSREFVELMPVDYAALDGEATKGLFLSGEALIYWGGSHEYPGIRDAASFNVDVAYFPPFTEDDFEGAPNTTYRIGGPSAAAQYGVPRSSENIELAVDFMRFFSTPENWGRISAASRYAFIPTVIGVQPQDAPQLDFFLEVTELPERLVPAPGGNMTAAAIAEATNIMHAFFLGASAEETKAAYQDLMMRVSLEACEKEGWDWCP